MLVVKILYFVQSISRFDGVAQVKNACIPVLEEQWAFVVTVVMTKNIAVKRISRKFAVLHILFAALYKGNGCGDVIEDETGPDGRNNAPGYLLVRQIHNVNNLRGEFPDIQIDEFRALDRAGQIETVMPVEFVEPGYEIR